jgi:hypothetical protein
MRFFTFILFSLLLLFGVALEGYGQVTYMVLQEEEEEEEQEVQEFLEEVLVEMVKLWNYKCLGNSLMQNSSS